MVSRAPHRRFTGRVVEARLNLPAGVGGTVSVSSHPIRLCGLGAASGEAGTKPVLVRRTEDEFLPALLGGLREKVSLEVLGLPNRLSQPNDFRDGNRYLYQPVHRTFNCVLLEASCRQPGFPRLDPKNVVSAGCVVRRVRSDHSSEPEFDEAWIHRDGSILGWRELPSGAYRQDPDPKLRVRRRLALNRPVHDQLAALLLPTAEGIESVSPLFVAPPEVCDSAGKTIVYGVVPVTSSEERTVPRAETVNEEVVRATAPTFLKVLDRKYQPVPRNSPITPEAITQAFKNQTDPLNVFLDDLRLLTSVWGVFESSNEARSVVAKLNGHQVRVVRPGTSTTEMRPLGDYLGEVVRRLILQTESGAVFFPDDWSQPPPNVASDVLTAVQGLLAARLRDQGPRLKRFDEPGALYRLHCFVRVRCADGCPPELHWSEPSDPFYIAPWWDSNGTAVHTVSLPDLTPDNIKRLKPNVAFVLPPKLAALLDQDPESLQKGEANPLPSNLTLGWICSFSIPIITLCAFIVLNIFLSLFKLIFSLLFGFGFSLKICLPFPKSSPPRP